MKNPKPKQRKVAIERFAHPSVDDIANDWLEGLIYDLAVFGDCYLELSGARDKEVGHKDSDNSREVPIWDFGGPLQSWYHVEATTMWLDFNEHGETRDPPGVSYFHTIKSKVHPLERAVEGLAEKGRAV